ncbi:minor capsid protein [Empedobacter sp.]|uniref:minor capsid protein n=1 Tax=Empedobacter sp. TaxID=1927715 RepID=UPI0028A09A32|nr:minor capsid protein [Empedobacter sp.]
MSSDDNQPDWADLLAAQWMDTVKEVYKDKDLPKDKVSRPIVKTQAERFEQGVNSILGEVDFDSPEFYLREVLRKNMWQFSAAKNYNDCVRLNNLLLDENGKLRSWSDFLYEAKKVIGDSVRYLKTEYNTIVAGAQMSRLWYEIQRDKAIFPFVQFLVVQDDHTSEICSPLHGLIFSVDDPVLAYYFPPNHFNCRTTVKKLRYGVPSQNYSLPEIPEAFKNNVAQTGEVFTSENKYIANAPKELGSDLEYYEENGIHVSNLAEKFSKSKVERERQKQEFENRKVAAKTLNEHFNEDTYIMPEILPQHWSFDFHFKGQPIAGKVTDIKVGSNFWELESYEGKFKKTKLGRMIKHGQEQSNNVVIKMNHNIPLKQISTQMRELFDKNEFQITASRIYIIDHKGKLIYIFDKDKFY